MMTYSTADLYDNYEKQHPLRVLAPIFKNFGGVQRFRGQVVTLKLFEDNSLVRQYLGNQGKGKVLVVDGGGSLRCALLGDNIAQLAIDNHWSGILIYGCVRDAKILSTMPIGIKALNTNPTKSIKRNEGQSELDVNFAGVTIPHDSFLYADEDGILISHQPLTDPSATPR